MVHFYLEMHSERELCFRLVCFELLIQGHLWSCHFIQFDVVGVEFYFAVYFTILKTDNFVLYQTPHFEKHLRLQYGFSHWFRAGWVRTDE